MFKKYKKIKERKTNPSIRTQINLPRSIHRSLLIAIIIFFNFCGLQMPKADGLGMLTLLNSYPMNLPIVKKYIPEINIPIVNNQKIRVVFQSSLKANSCYIKETNTLGTGSITTYETSTNANDTVVISPSTSWNTGSAKTITLEGCSGNDLPAFSFFSIILTYDVYDYTKVRYVSTNGNDSNSGTIDSPKQTIDNAGVNLLPCSTLDCAVFVENGNYNIINPLIMDDGISFFGGFSESYMKRDVINRTTVVENVNAACGGLAGAPCTVFKTNGATNVSDKTMLSGFVIQGNKNTGSSYSAGIHLTGTMQANPKIFYNTINGGSGVNESRGMYIQNVTAGKEPVIHSNTIHGGAGTTSSGLNFGANANGIVYNNSIDGGVGSTQTTGVLVGNTNSDIILMINNIIIGGTGSPVASVGILISSSNNVSLFNNLITSGRASGSARSLSLTGAGNFSIIAKSNLIFSVTGGTITGINEVTIGSMNTFAYNNFTTTGSLYWDQDSAGNKSIAWINSQPGHTDNKNLQPMFKDPSNGDFHFTNNSPCSLTKGGGTINSYATIDLEYKTRTDPISIGPYEWDGDCQ